MGGETDRDGSRRNTHRSKGNAAARTGQNSSKSRIVLLGSDSKPVA